MHAALAGQSPRNWLPSRMTAGTSSRATSSNPSRSALSLTVVVRM